MREIKFRIWNPKHKEMGVVWTLGEIAQETVLWSDYLITMQYTGLKDCKRTAEYPDGQEIYEGDIVKLNHNSRSVSRYHYIDQLTGDDDAKPVGIVSITTYKGVTCRWPSKRYRELWDDGITRGDLELEGESVLQGEQTDSSSVERWEVIGNIYENPELLGGTDDTPRV